MGLGPVGFDLDMTLIDSRPAIMASFEATSRDMSAGIDLDAVDGRLGVKLEDELAYWFPPEGIAEAAGCYRRHYVRLAAEKTSTSTGGGLQGCPCSAPGRGLLGSGRGEVGAAGGAGRLCW